MKKNLIGLILVIFISGIVGFVVAQETVNCTTTAECPTYDTGIYCNNLSELCTSFKTSGCVDSICVSTTNITCTPCNYTCQNNTCIEISQQCDSGHLNLCLNETNCETAGGEWKNATCVVEDEDENETETNETGSGGRVSINKTRISRENLTFTPWQKRNESECLEGCSCHGAVMSCETETGKVMTIQAGRSGNIIVITIDGTQVETELEVETETNEDNETKIKAKLGNGAKKEIKIMPDTASERALEKLRLRNCVAEEGCTIKLKEVGSNRLAYELQAERRMKVLAMFTAKAMVKAQVDAETGEIIIVKKPWWAFLATEPVE